MVDPVNLSLGSAGCDIGEARRGNRLTDDAQASRGALMAHGQFPGDGINGGNIDLPLGELLNCISVRHNPLTSADFIRRNIGGVKMGEKGCRSGL